MKNMLHAIRVIFILIFSFQITFSQDFEELEKLLKKTKDKQSKAEITNQIGIKYRDNGELNQAIGYHFEALDLYEELQDRDGQATTLNYLGGVYWRLNDFEQAVHYYTLALQIREQEDDVEERARILNNLGLASKSLGDYNTSLQFYYRALGCWLEKDEKGEVAKTLNFIGNVYLNRNMSDSALNYYKMSLKIREKEKDTVAIASTYNNIATLYKKQNDFATAVAYIEKSINLLPPEELGKLGDAYNNLGGVYWLNKEYKKSLSNYLKALDIREKQGNKKQIAATINNIGLIYKDLGNYEKALEYYNRSLKQYQETNDRFMESNALNFIAGVYWQSGHYDMARNTYFRSLALRKMAGDKNYIARSHNNIALVYKSIGERDSALMQYQEALSIYKELGDQKNAATLLNNIGNLHLKFEEYPEAEQYFKIALSARKEIADLIGEAYSSLDLGKAYVAQNNFVMAPALYSRALWIAQQLKNTNLEKDVLYSFSEVYAKSKQYKKAYEYHDAYSELKDEILSTESIKKIADMQIRYETEKKEKEIEKQNSQIQRQNERNKRQRNILYFAIAIIAIISISVIFIIRQNRKIKKAHDLLALKNAEIFQQNEEILTQRDSIQEQKNEIETQHKKLVEARKKTTDSITYAFKIQKAMLPPENLMKKVLNNYFIMYRPKDIVSGDFYWMNKIGDLSFVAAVDCTGHGVPGSIMSMLGNTLLNEVVTKNATASAAEILNELRDQIKSALNQTGKNEDIDDAMDCAFCIIDHANKKLQFAGANNPLYLFRKLDEPSLKTLNAELPKQLEFSSDENQTETTFLFNKVVKAKRLEKQSSSKKNKDQYVEPPILKGEMFYTLSGAEADRLPFRKKINENKLKESNALIHKNDEVIHCFEVEGDRMPLGINKFIEEPFTNHEIDIQEDDTIYLFSDGFYDQFGGPKGRKLLSKYFKLLIAELQSFPFDQQQVELEKRFEEWQGENRQIDDVIVVGIKI